ncbi:MAG: hypothetical protein IJC73_05070 [Lentisphaeria bacterium]|nr:hypothetical protein [Lentisphaeria bacterium]
MNKFHTHCLFTGLLLFGTVSAAAAAEAIPGTTKDKNNDPTGGYAPTQVQTQFNIDVKSDTRVLNVIRDNNDPFVVTKAYQLKHADPYAVRSYLLAAIRATSITENPVQVSALKYRDGRALVMVSAEEYRFQDHNGETGLDTIIKRLDRPNLIFVGDNNTYLYFPKYETARNLRDMLLKVGASARDDEFALPPDHIMVDAELNALLISAPAWSWKQMQQMLTRYDMPLPEVRISYRIIEFYDEDDNHLGNDFQSWKNNDGVDLFSAGAITRRNWGTFFTSGVTHTGNNNTSYWNFNPKWNTRYIDVMSSIGQARCLARGVLRAKNRVASELEINSGFFYDRNDYKDGATSIAEGTTEFVFADPNPDAIRRESTAKIIPSHLLTEVFGNNLSAAGYTLRMMNTQTTTNTYADTTAYIAKNVMGLGDVQANAQTSALSKYLLGYMKADGTIVPATYHNQNWDTVNAAPGVIHGKLQYPMVADGFRFAITVYPVITEEAAKLNISLNSISLIGFNSDGSVRTSSSNVHSTVQIGYDAEDFIIGGITKTETVRTSNGIPFLKNLPIFGYLFSTETESIKQSRIALVATVEYVQPEDQLTGEHDQNVGKILRQVNHATEGVVGNLGYKQIGIDSRSDDEILKEIEVEKAKVRAEKRAKEKAKALEKAKAKAAKKQAAAAQK